MTENTPPIPSAPRPGPAYPSHSPFGSTQGYEHPSGTAQPYNPAPWVADAQQSQYSQPQFGFVPPQWYQAASKPKSSGLRVGAGIVSIVLGAVLLLASMAGFASNVIVGLLLLVAALG